MNLLTTCALTGALATSFLVRPTIESPEAARTAVPSVALAGALPGAPVSAPAEEPRTARKFENPTWSRVVHISFLPGKKADAIGIIQDYFRPASVASGGSQPLAFEHVTGEYDLTAIWELTEGMESLNWEVSPANVAWRAALAKRLGGADKAEALMATYQSYIRKTEVDLLRTLDLKAPSPTEASATR